MRRKRSIQKKLEEKKIARERIKELFNQAQEICNKNLALANRYTTLARKIAMKYNCPIPSMLKRRFCKHCYKYLIPGKNCRIRTKDKKVVIYCQECKKHTRIPYYKRKN